MKISVLCAAAALLAAAAACRTTGGAMMSVSCSGCAMKMKADMTLNCPCGAAVQVGDLLVQCGGCKAETKLSACTGACPKCGMAASQKTAKAKCPACQGVGEMKGLACPHCSKAKMK